VLTIHEVDSSRMDRETAIIMCCNQKPLYCRAFIRVIRLALLRMWSRKPLFFSRKGLEFLFRAIFLLRHSRAVLDFRSCGARSDRGGLPLGYRELVLADDLARLRYLFCEARTLLLAIVDLARQIGDPIVRGGFVRDHRFQPGFDSRELIERLVAFA